NAGDAALEDREIALDGVGMHVSTNIFANAVIDRMVVRRTVPGTCAAIVTHRASSFRNLFVHDRTKRLSRHIRNVMRANFPAALMPFLLAHMRCVARSHLVIGICERS